MGNPRRFIESMLSREGQLRKKRGQRKKARQGCGLSCKFLKPGPTRSSRILITPQNWYPLETRGLAAFCISLSGRQASSQSVSQSVISFSLPPSGENTTSQARGQFLAKGGSCELLITNTPDSWGWLHQHNSGGMG